MKRLLSAIVVVAIFFSIAATALAAEEHMDTVNDLFAIYNEAQLDDYSLLQKEYLEAAGKLADAEKLINDAEMHNALLDAAIQWQTDEKNRISKEIKELSKHSLELSKQISASFDADWETLVQLDKAYKMNLSKMNQLLGEYDKFSLSEKRIADYDTLDELTAEVSELQQTYKEASDVKVLGDVYNVVYPLGKASVMTSGYGNRIDPISGVSVSYHGGIDLRANVGTDVLALFNGTVIGTGYTTAGGYYVNIDHGNGVRSYYCHLNEILCEKGQQVSQYDVIARSGNTGTRTTGPHLHLALYINGNPVNPEILFKEG